jgi:hypothetical protein
VGGRGGGLVGRGMKDGGGGGAGLWLGTCLGWVGGDYRKEEGGNLVLGWKGERG